MKLFVLMAVCTFIVWILNCPSTPETMQSASFHQTKTKSPQVSKVSSNEEVREILRPHCGNCHTSTLSTAKPGALKVFDLARENWLSTASPKQLESILSRTKSFPTEERTKVVQLIEHEKTRRASL